MRRVREVVLVIGGGIAGFFAGFFFGDHTTEPLVLVTSLLGAVLMFALSRSTRF
jgi:thioredoxin reductase